MKKVILYVFVLNLCLVTLPALASLSLPASAAPLTMKVSFSAFGNDQSGSLAAPAAGTQNLDDDDSPSAQFNRHCQNGHESLRRLNELFTTPSVFSPSRRGSTSTTSPSMIYQVTDPLVLNQELESPPNSGNSLPDGLGSALNSVSADPRELASLPAELAAASTALPRPDTFQKHLEAIATGTGTATIKSVTSTAAEVLGNITGTVSTALMAARVPIVTAVATAIVTRQLSISQQPVRRGFPLAIPAAISTTNTAMTATAYIAAVVTTMIAARKLNGWVHSACTSKQELLKRGFEDKLEAMRTEVLGHQEETDRLVEGSVEVLNHHGEALKVLQRAIDPSINREQAKRLSDALSDAQKGINEENALLNQRGSIILVPKEKVRCGGWC